MRTAKAQLDHLRCTGVGFSMYHVVNLSTGCESDSAGNLHAALSPAAPPSRRARYLVGRLGLFGAPVDAASMPVLRDSSILVLLLSFCFMLAVEPRMDGTSASADAAAAAEGAAKEDTHSHAEAPAGGESSQSREEAQCASAPSGGALAPLMQPLLADEGSSTGGVDAAPGIEAYRQNYRAWRMGGNKGAKEALLRRVQRARGARFDSWAAP